MRIESISSIRMMLREEAIVYSIELTEEIKKLKEKIKQINKITSAFHI